MLAKYWRFSPSSIRGVPGEVLQQIFAFVVFNEDGGASNINSCMRLRCLCSVSHQWRQAAIGHCILWTRLHPITVGHTDETRIRKSIRRLHLHLERSGVLPISFSLTIYPVAWPQKGITDPAIFDLLRVLLNQCHRWGKVQFNVPLICFAEKFNHIRGNIPLLSELAIDSAYWPYWVEADDSQPQLDCFAHAPSLRKVVYADSSQWNHVSLFTRFELPWSQVEELKVDGGITGTVMTQLDTLTLPSLKHLEVRRRTSPGPTFDSILGLIKRSGCSLEHLCVLTLEHGPQVSFPKILALSPQITELYIASPGDDMLEALISDPTSPDPVLPKMKTLLIFDRYLGGARSINIAALSAVIKSRTGRLGKGEDTRGMAQALEEVILYSLWWDNGDWRGNGNWWDSGDWWDNGETLQKQISLLETAHADGGGVEIARIPNPLEELASEARTTLFLDFAPQVVTRGHVYNLSRHFKMHQLMSKLERVDLEKDNSRIFVYKGIAYLLALVNLRERGQVPGDPLFQFRSRAGKLLKKWKPFLIRDVNSYTWGHAGKDITCMKWIPGSIVEGSYRKDEDIWNVITGRDLAPRIISRF
ncbi:hypothetical protein D9611_002997 [Ephemerocybe angulata]|uniref:F-box domain-containing protein n=1 Tax=Ephemerocybe angulata TaxID=980116 RepID=A0A8H5C8L8_9AGAR|nr:hypothetical protein D9611_002997 [Tulosesus angulatus]